MLDNFSNHNLVVIPEPNGDCKNFQNSPIRFKAAGETYGNDSKCFLGSIIRIDENIVSSITPLCYKTKCENQKISGVPI